MAICTILFEKCGWFNTSLAAILDSSFNSGTISRLMNILNTFFSRLVSSLKGIGVFLSEIENKLDVFAEELCDCLVDYYPKEHRHAGRIKLESVSNILACSVLFFLLGWAAACVTVSLPLYSFLGFTMPFYEFVGTVSVHTRNFLWIGSPILFALALFCVHFLNAARRVWIH